MVVRASIDTFKVQRQMVFFTHVAMTSIWWPLHHSQSLHHANRTTVQRIAGESAIRFAWFLSSIHLKQKKCKHRRFEQSLRFNTTSNGILFGNLHILCICYFSNYNCCRSCVWWWRHNGCHKRDTWLHARLYLGTLRKDTGLCDEITPLNFRKWSRANRHHNTLFRAWAAVANYWKRAIFGSSPETVVLNESKIGTTDYVVEFTWVTWRGKDESSYEFHEGGVSTYIDIQVKLSAIAHFLYVCCFGTNRPTNPILRVRQFGLFGIHSSTLYTTHAHQTCNLTLFNARLYFLGLQHISADNLWVDIGISNWNA